jgi:hypothetical protein
LAILLKPANNKKGHASLTMPGLREALEVMDDLHSSGATQDQFVASPTHGEVLPATEAAAIAAIVQAAEARVRAAARTGPARRDAHVKPHGCVKARFEVLEDLPNDLKVGVLAEPKTFDAWIRFSNGADPPAADRIGDGRGMAIKLMDVAGSAATTQDFLMINYPVFFVRDAADYVEFTTAANPLKFFLPGLNPFGFRLRELWNALAITRQTVTNPLNIRYWSMTPYAMGEVVCKYSARPVGPLSKFVAADSPDFLRENLAAHLAQGEATFDFLVQPRPSASALPIEDPRILWPESLAPFIRVARILIPSQSFESEAQKAFCENLSFTPWHALAAHQPLGGIGRVRRAVYETVSRVRHQLNGAPQREPAGF